MYTDRRITVSAYLALGVLLVRATPVLADGGRVQLSETVAAYRITVFTSPTPVSAGAVDVSVLLQRMDNGAIIDDAVIDVELIGGDVARTIRGRASNANTNNKLMKSVSLAIPSAGLWHVAVTIKEASTVHVGFDLRVYESSNRMLTVATCLMIPLLICPLFLLREYLADRERHTGPYNPQRDRQQILRGRRDRRRPDWEYHGT